MNKSNLASLGLIVLAYGGITVMTATDAPRASAEAKAAAKSADRATKALARHDGADAISAAEAAVAAVPQVANYRMLLGQSYLQSGRFASAGQAFADVLQLDPGNGRAALNLALAQIATGDWQAARTTLTRYAATIPAGDRGLALALAGDTAAGVAVLTQVARSPETTAKVRQNLALAYALAGQWEIARVVASADMSPADVGARMEQWATFVQPTAASDQVASLLGVKAAADSGQPTALALNAPLPTSAPVAVAGTPAEPAAPVAVAPAAAAPVTVAATGPARVTFGPRKEVVQALPVELLAASGPIKTAIAPKPGFSKRTPVRLASARSASGNWFVQLGAYDNAGVARDGWSRIRRRFTAFAGRTPNGVAFKAGPATFYRLSVGGFARADAVQACRQYKARGGDCFVRAGAGDQVANWIKPATTQLAMR